MAQTNLASATTEQDSFDLHTSGTAGRGRGIVIDSDSLAWECGGQHRRRAFNDIATIRLWADLHADGPFALCDVIFANDERLTVMMSDKDFDPCKGMKYAVYRTFVLRLFERLGPAKRTVISFVEGPTALRRLSWIIGSASGLAACLGVSVVGAVSDWFNATDNSWLLLPLLLFFAALMAGLLVLSLKTGQRNFDPEDVPPHALPPVPGETAPGTA